MAFDSSTALTARAELAERLERIGLRYLPDDFSIEYRKSLSGRCHFGKLLIIQAPRPVTRKALYIFLHECGHANLHRPTMRKRPRYVEEFEAEQFAHLVMRHEGVPIPRDMTVRAKGYVRRKMRQAAVRGGFRFREDICAWADGAPSKSADRLKPDNRWRTEIAAVIAALPTPPEKAA